eukprot:TRINITY_DN704_c0_g1_i1.p1 TRINITY_DN704_c0_g1~~TRINITY_DN704_c0_g1_i1.p1  ORF type:complete len:503 (-),score=12.19 TRINITY_DN704_c0_g1_i1:1135-2643(-)
MIIKNLNLDNWFSKEIKNLGGNFYQDYYFKFFFISVLSEKSNKLDLPLTKYMNLSGSNYVLYRTKFLNNLIRSGKRDRALNSFYKILGIFKGYGQIGEIILLYILNKITPAIDVKTVKTKRALKQYIVILNVKRRVLRSVKLLIHTLKTKKKGKPFDTLELFDLLWSTLSNTGPLMEYFTKKSADIQKILYLNKGRLPRKRYYGYAIFKKSTRYRFWVESRQAIYYYLNFYKNLKLKRLEQRKNDKKGLPWPRKNFKKKKNNKFFFKRLMARPFFSLRKFNSYINLYVAQLSNNVIFMKFNDNLQNLLANTLNSFQHLRKTYSLFFFLKPIIIAISLIVSIMGTNQDLVCWVQVRFLFSIYFMNLLKSYKVTLPAKSLRKDELPRFFMEMRINLDKFLLEYNKRVEGLSPFLKVVVDLAVNTDFSFNFNFKLPTTGFLISLVKFVMQKKIYHTNRTNIISFSAVRFDDLVKICILKFSVCNYDNFSRVLSTSKAMGLKLVFN